MPTTGSWRGGRENGNLPANMEVVYFPLYERRKTPAVLCALVVRFNLGFCVQGSDVHAFETLSERSPNGSFFNMSSGISHIFPELGNSKQIAVKRQLDTGAAGSPTIAMTR